MQVATKNDCALGSVDRIDDDLARVAAVAPGRTSVLYMGLVWAAQNGLKKKTYCREQEGGRCLHDNVAVRPPSIHPPRNWTRHQNPRRRRLLTG